MGLFGDVAKLGKGLWDVGADVKDFLSDAGEVVDTVKDLGKDIQRIAKGAGLDNVAKVGAKLFELGKTIMDNKFVSKFLKAANSPILDAGQVVIAGMRLTTGFGDPEDGRSFGDGMMRFTEVTGTLQSTVPNDSWDGTGSHAYAEQNARQQARTEAMAAADRQVVTVVAREAYQIGFTRGKLDDQSNWLADVGLVTMAMGFIPEVGQAVKMAAEIAAVQAALSSCSIDLYRLASETSQNAAEIQQAVGRYADVASTAQPSGAPTAFNPPPGGDAPPGTPQLPITADRAETATPSGPAVDRQSPGTGAGGPTVGAPPVGGGIVGSSSGGPGAGASRGGPSGQPPSTSPAEPAPMPDLPLNSAAGSPRSSDGSPGSSGASPGSSGGGMSGSGMDFPGSLLGEVGKLVAERTASVGQSGQPDADGAKDKNAKDKAKPPDGITDKNADDEEDKKDQEGIDQAGVTPGQATSERAPIHIEVDIDPERSPGPFTVRLDRENPPAPPATTAP